MDDDYVEFRQEPWRPAVESGDLSQLQDLIQQQGLAVLTKNSINEYDNAVMTPLLQAVCMGNMDMVRYLLEECSSVVDVNAQSDEDELLRCTSLHIATQDSNLELVRYLVEKGCNVNAVALNQDKTALHIAVEMQHVDIVKCLIDTGLCDVDLATSRDGDPAAATALSLAVDYRYCDNLEIVQYIMERGPWTDEEKADRATKVLPAPCESGNLEMVTYLVDSCGANVNAHGFDDYYYGTTPLIVACEHGYLEIVQYLVESCSADVEAFATDYRKMNPLLTACESGHLEIIRYLIEKCAANVKTTQGALKERTPLHFACQSGKLDAVQYLVEKCRVDVEARDKDGDTALHKAARFGRLDIVQYLVEKCGSNVEAKNGEQWTALHMTCNRNEADAIAVAQYFLDVCNASRDVPNSEGATALHIASRDRNVEMVQCLIRAGRIRVNAVDTNGQTAMHSCLVGRQYGRDAIVDAEKCLAVAKVFAAFDPTIFDARDNDGRTILLLACEKAMFRLVQYLVQECRIDVSAATNVGETALIIASRERHVSIVQCLTSLANTDVNAADENGRTALHFACSGAVDEEQERTRNHQRRSASSNSKCCKIGQCLLKTGRVDVNAQDNQGKTALHHSVVNPAEVAPHDLARQKYLQDACFKLVQLLVESGRVSIDTMGNTGQTVLHYYCSFPNLDIPRYLIEHAHANVDTVDHEGRTALHRAASIARSYGIRSGLRLVLFLVSRLSADVLGRDDDVVERSTPILDGTGNDGHSAREESLPKRQRT